MTEKAGSAGDTSRFNAFLKANKVLIGAATIAVVAGFLVLFIIGANNAKSINKKTRCSVSACVSLFRRSTEPEVITVKAGSYVQFNSGDGQKHNIALVHSGVQHEDESRYESGDFGADEGWKVQFKKDGSYTFADKYNQKAEISIVVYTPGRDYKVK